MYRQPTDLTWNAQGDIFIISDGYVNARVAKYDGNGDWVSRSANRAAAPAS